MGSGSRDNSLDALGMLPATRLVIVPGPTQWVKVEAFVCSVYDHGHTKDKLHH